MKVGTQWEGVVKTTARLFFWAFVFLGFVFILSLTSCSRGYGCPSAF